MFIFITYTIVTTIFILSILLFFISLNKDYSDVLFRTSFIVFVASLFTLLIIFSNTQIETIYEVIKVIVKRYVQITLEMMYNFITGWFNFKNI